MKLRINRQEAAEALAAICTVASARTPKESLRCVRIDAQSDVLVFSATDLELSLRCPVTHVEVTDTGATLVVAETLSRIVHECSDELLDLEVTGNHLHIRGAGSHFQIVTQELSGFPVIASLDDDPQFTVEHKALARLIELSLFAAARESTRYAINGVLWEVKGSALTLAATDGRRLAVVHGEVKAADQSAERRAIVPAKAMTLLNRLPVEGDSVVGVGITDNQLILKMGGAVLCTALVEGQFPNYQDVIPGDCDRVFRLNTLEFQSALKRAALLTNEESKGVRLSFSEGTLTLSSRAPEQGEATISLPVDGPKERLEIGFNPLFLLDVLRVLQAEELTLALKEENRPGVIRQGEAYVYVVMPVNLSSA